MIKAKTTLEISREDLMRLIQMYFERLYDSRIVIRGRIRGMTTGGAYYVNIPAEIVKRYNLLGKAFRITKDGDDLIIEESQEGLRLKKYGGKRGIAYYLLLPKETVGEITPGIRVKIFIEQEKPLKLRIILPRSA